MEANNQTQKYDLSKPGIVADLPIPEVKQAIYWDAGQKHLGLAISPKGKRSWILERRVDGRTVRRVLGDHARLKYKDALAEFRAVDGNLEQGKDHVAEKKAAKVEAATQARISKPTLADALAEYVAGKIRAKDGLPLKERTRSEYLAMVAAPRAFKAGQGMTAGGELFALAGKRLNEITADDMREAYAAAAARGKRRGVYAMQVLRATMNWYGVAVPDNPLSKTAAGKDRIILAQTRPAPSPIPPEQVGVWWKSSFEVRSQNAADLLRLMLLTGARGAEVKALKVRDYDAGAGRLICTDTKNRGDHVILLSKQAGAIVARHAAGKKPGELLFAIEDAGKTMATICKLAGVAGRTPHDLRHTFASIAEELCSAYALKRMLNHAAAGDVTSFYVGKSDAQLRAAWQAVADAIEAAQ